MSSRVYSQGHGRPLVAGVLTTALLLSGCGGGGSSPGPTSYSVGGSVSGLQSGASVVLQNNGGNATTVSANGAFDFSSAVASGSGYSVTVETQPSGQTCSVSGGSGTVGSANISISVSCVTNPALAMLAGTGTGPGNANGSPTAARFNAPFGVAIDASGNTYVVDSDSDTVRKITAAGAVSTFAGTAGQPGSADGMGAAARFRTPRGIAVDGAGNVYVSDTGNDTIRKITPAGAVTTLAGVAGVAGSVNGTGSAAQFWSPQGIGTDGAGNVYVADSFNNVIREITPAGVVTTLAGTFVCGATDGAGSSAQFCRPFGLAVDSAGNVDVADSLSETIRQITPSGVVSTLAGYPGLAGSTDGTGASARFNLPSGLAIDTAGNIYVADTGNGTVRMITPGLVVSTLAGTAGVLGYADGTGSAAEFRGGQGPAVDSQGNVYLADNNNLVIRKITSQGVVSTFAGMAPELGSADGTGSVARFYGPSGLAADSAGNVYIADTLNCEIRKMTSAGAVTTLAGSPAYCSYPGWGDADGNGAAAEFAWPNGVAVDGTGTVYVADTYNQSIRKITPTGTVTTLVPGILNNLEVTLPSGLITDSAGNVYVASTGDDTIREVTPAGVVTTLAGTSQSAGSADGNGAGARFSDPVGITIDTAGNLYVSDSDNDTIRKITPAGDVTTLAGTAGVVGSADGAGAAAQFDQPTGITIDASGNLYVVDSGNYTIRKITPAGVVTTVVGVAGQTGFTAGALPGVLDAQTAGVAISGSSLYISTYAGIAVVTNLP